MDDSEEKDSRDDFLSHKKDNVENGDQLENNRSPSHEHQEEAQDESIFSLPKMVESGHDKEQTERFEFHNQPQPHQLSDFNPPPVSDPKILMPELNHLNALANLDPSAKFSDPALRDMRFGGSGPNGSNLVPIEDEDNKVFMCHLCDFKTAYANSLMNHQAVHSDVRPWACAMCEYAAKRKQDLKKHLHTVHGMMVESPMLKPILPSNSGGIPKFPGMNDGLKDQYVEGLNLKRSASSEQEFPFFPAAAASSSGHQPFAAKRIKEELPSFDMMSQSATPHERKMPSTSDAEESPDDNLPICFPASVSKPNDSVRSRESPLFPEMFPHMPPNRENGELGMPYGPTMPWPSKKRDKYHEAAMREWAQYSKSRESAMFPSGFTRDKPHHLDSMTMKTSSMGRTRDENLNHSLSDDESNGDEAVHNHSVTLPNESLKPNETDRSISSSSTVIHARSSQTQPGFMCEHCDILFFQRAMYLMHVGLHSPNNPWRCAVCGHSFSEKYSFTSHFINQH